MLYLLIPVFVEQFSPLSGETLQVTSLVYTNTLNIVEAKKLSAFHIYHLHENKPENLPSVHSVVLNKGNSVYVDEYTTIKFGAIKTITVNQQRIIGSLGLFGYNKKLKPKNKSLLFI
jgi:hypothetical protein